MDGGQIVRFGLLGPLSIELDGQPVSLSAPRQRALLVLLLLDPGAPVPGARIIDQLWRDEPPASASTALRVLLSQLRRVLEPGRARGDASIIERTAGGWSIQVEPGAIDSQRFETGCSAGREAHEAGDLERASACYRRALAEWRGPPMTDVVDDLEAAATAAGRWDEQRLQTLELCAEAELDLGRHRQLTGELLTLVDEHPFREGFVRLAMLALYRSGRQTEALRAYSELRERLVEELGIEPAPELAQLERSILRQESSLAGSLHVGGLPPPSEPTGPDAAAATAEPEEPRPGATAPLPRYLDQLRSRATIVGRGDVLDDVDRFCTEVFAGRTAVLAIEGPAGIGKSRLAAEIGARFHAAGGRVLFGRCDREPLMSYQPVVEALDDHLATAPDRDVVRAQPWPDELRRLIGELATGDPVDAFDAAGAHGVDRESRYVLFEAMVDLVVQLGEHQPVALCIDDLQWADEATTALLRHLIRRLPDRPILITATIRNDEVPFAEDVRSLLSEIEREMRLRSIELGRLDADASLQLLTELWSDGQADLEAYAPRLFRLAEGNPLFLRQLARHLGTSSGPGGRIDGSLPDEISTLVRSRLHALSARARDVLCAGAVIGREFDLEVLAAVVDDEPDDLLETVDELLRSRLVNEVGGMLDRYTFAHELVREVSYRELSASRRARLHLRAGEALEHVDGRATDAGPGRLAYHFSLAGPPGRAKAAVHASAAGQRAMDVMAFPDAAASFRQALTLSRLDGVSAEREVELLLALGEALISAGRPIEGRQVYRQGAVLARDAGLHVLLAHALLGQGRQWGNSEEIDDAFLLALEDALARLPLDELTLRAKVAARLASGVFFMRGADESEPLGIEAVRLARRQTDDAALVSALHARHLVMQIDAPPAARMAVADELVERSRTGSPESRVTARWDRAINVIELGHRADIDAELRAYRELADRSRQPVNLWWSEVLEGAIETCRGDLAVADERVERAYALGTELGQEDATRVYAGQLFMLRWLQDRLDELLPLCETFLAEQPDFQPWRAAVALARAETGDEPAARRALLELVEALDGGRRDYLWVGTLVIAGEVAYQLRDRTSARTVLRRLTPYAGRHLMYGPGFAALGPVDRSLGQLQALCGDPAAGATLRLAEQMADDAGAVPYGLLARTARLAIAPAADGATDSELQSVAHTAEELGIHLVTRRIDGAGSHLHVG